jgi:hypothetical protein
MKTLTLFSCALLLHPMPGFAQSTSTSALYTLLHAPAGDLGGGGRVTNAGATVIADISVGDPASGVVSAVTAGGAQTKGNLIGQLFDPQTVSVTATPATIDEGGTRQLIATATMDDATTLGLAGHAIWTFGPPISAIDAITAVATAGPVFQNTTRQISARFRGVSGSLSLTVLNVNSDNYLHYAGDGLDDAWQMTHFGLPPNASAAPTADPDGDGSTNLREWKALTNPLNGASVFLPTCTITGPDLIISFPTVVGRTYTLERSDTVAPDSWTSSELPAPLAGNGAVRSFIVPAAAPFRRFFRVLPGV